MFKERIASALAKTKIKFNNVKPELLVYGGIALVVGGGVYACVQTMKAPKILEEHNDRIEKIKTYKAHITEPELYPENDYRKDVAKTYLHTATKLVKVYSGPAVIGAVGVGFILRGHALIRSENAALLASYGALQAAYDEYRERVRQATNDEFEDRIMNGGVIDGYDTVKDENGKIKKEKKSVEFVKPVVDPYSVIFEEVTSPSLWTPVASTNRMNVVAIQAECNRMLEAEGYLFLNDVLRMLGMKETEISRKVGWVKHKPGTPYVVGDSEGFVDFGLFRRGQGYDAARYEFLNDPEPNFMLHFNVQGVIIDKFEAASRRAI